MVKNAEAVYNGYEVGPIRPPSEARSLLLRLTRNCPWNRCKFCYLYKNKKFSVRPVEHILRDIDQIKKWTDEFSRSQGRIPSLVLEQPGDDYAFYMAQEWYASGMKSVFLQDANSLVLKPEKLVEILQYLRKNFPSIERITAYGRSQTLAKISDENMQALAAAGLNRIHVGMETGSTKILELIKKGVDKETHIIAGQKVKRAGIELSEYFMPGIGGKEYSYENAAETADALNQINPDFIRIRTFAMRQRIELFEDYQKGVFTRTNDIDMVKELLYVIKHLEGVTSYLISDHMINLLQEVEGKFPEDKERMIKIIEKFLALDIKEQMIFRIGRRTGRMFYLKDLHDPFKREQVEKIMETHNINESNIDEICDEIIKRFV
ncbi:MAG: radical SAM protein [Peptococcaceae bacterium]|nr:radical SAM protein [Peptococcaceae bacterium]